MRKALLPLFLVIPWSASVLAQRLPDYGQSRARITEPDGGSLLIETRHAKEPRLDYSKTYYWYSANRIHTTQGGYSGKLLNGPYQEFDGAKNLRERGAFKNGLKSGTWKAWNEAGRLTGQTTWNKGRRQGIFSQYDNEGKLTRKGKYKGDQVSGKVLVYSGPDSVRTLYHKAGREVTSQGTSSGPSFWKRLWPFGNKSRKEDMAGSTNKGMTGSNNNLVPMVPAGTSGMQGNPGAEKVKKQKKARVKKADPESGAVVLPGKQ
jgi:hypothetical protein